MLMRARRARRQEPAHFVASARKPSAVARADGSTSGQARRCLPQAPSVPQVPPAGHSYTATPTEAACATLRI
ncbi:hypothetical protein, partial [Streptomyces olivaceoviridis]